jgi:hypothetical protein
MIRMTDARDNGRRCVNKIKARVTSTSWGKVQVVQSTQCA